MKSEARINQLIVKIAGRCNLDCTYCYMYHGADQSWRSKPKQMSDEVFDMMLWRARSYCEAHAPHRISLSLHGGEPLLVGKDRLSRFVRTARDVMGEHLVDIAVQTNGTLIDDEWALLLAELNVGLGISIDGPASVHDASRQDRRGGGSHSRVVQGLIRLRAAGFNPMGLCVIDPRADGAAVYRHLRDIGLKRIDFLIPDVTHETVAKWRPKDRELPIAQYLLAVADAWLGEDDPEVEVRILHGLFRRLMGGPHLTDAFGNPRLSYLVVESNGAIEGNDVLKVCAPGMAETGLNVLTNGFDDLDPYGTMVGRMVHEGVGLCDTCRRCPHVAICGGGYLPHRWSKDRGFDNPSAWCGDIQALLEGLEKRCGPMLPTMADRCWSF
jgi:uncharacterized protein